MRAKVRWLLVVGAALAVAAMSSGTAVAATGDVHRLLVRYQPVTVLDPNESFAPTTTASFVADANLETQTAPGTWTLVTASPLTTNLPTIPTAACVAQALVPCYRLSQRDCSPTTGVSSLSCFQTDWLTPPPRSVVYGRATKTRRMEVLQYWYFYYDDFYSYNYPPNDFIWQTHEGDWEAVTILIRRGSSRPNWVGYSQHCTGARRSWSAVPRWHGSTHPLVDVAIGSHANYFSTGDHPIAEQCIPPQAIAYLQSQGLALPVDYSHVGQAYGPANSEGVKPTALARVSATFPEWMRYIGTWGQYQYFHAPSPINTVASGFSPPSPPASVLWQHPVKTVLGWPRTG